MAILIPLLLFIFILVLPCLVINSKTLLSLTIWSTILVTFWACAGYLMSEAFSGLNKSGPLPHSFFTAIKFGLMASAPSFLNLLCNGRDLWKNAR